MSSLAPNCSVICLALPLAYFQSRRVGDSVARIRELENIRNFLTGSALTLVIDLLFTVVFLGVMFIYSGLLTWIVIASLPIYIGISVWVSPILRHRVNEKFRTGAVNQGFLVETITGIETLESDGGRAANAAPLGRAAGKLCPHQFCHRQSGQHRQPGGAVRQQGRQSRRLYILARGW